MSVYFLSDDTHFKTNPKIPGIDLNSVRILFETLSKPAFSGLLEQVHPNSVFTHTCVQGNTFIFITWLPVFQGHQQAGMVDNVSDLKQKYKRIFMSL